MRTTYPDEHWEALGRWVLEARRRAGYADTKVWKQAVGRSERMLLGLERGERVGTGTIDAVASALNIEPGLLFGILESGEAAPSGAAAPTASKVPGSMAADMLVDLVIPLLEKLSPEIRASLVQDFYRVVLDAAWREEHPEASPDDLTEVGVAEPLGLDEEPDSPLSPSPDMEAPGR